jgi:hypothetical protein
MRAYAYIPLILMSFRAFRNKPGGIFINLSVSLTTCAYIQKPHPCKKIYVRNVSLSQSLGKSIQQ